MEKGLIIGLSAKIKAGKTTAAKFVQEKTNNLFQEKYFAYKLKLIASILTGDPIEKFETQEGKAEYLPEWGMTRRDILQKLGTQALRDNFHKDVHIKALFADIKPENNIVISDFRFINESQAIKDRGGALIRINRSIELRHPEEWYIFKNLIQHNTPFKPSESDFIDWLHNHSNKRLADLHDVLTHRSEIELDNYKDFDYVIENNGSLEDFESKLNHVLNKILSK
jgi:hypothetical protein